MGKKWRWNWEPDVLVLKTFPSSQTAALHVCSRLHFLFNICLNLEYLLKNPWSNRSTLKKEAVFSCTFCTVFKRVFHVIVGLSC